MRVFRPSFFINKNKKTIKEKMSRLTGSEAQKLLEAYDAVYTSQEEVVEQDTEQLDEVIRPTTGQQTAPKATPVPQPKPQVAGGGMGGRRGSGVRYSTGPTAADLQRQRSQASAKPAPTQNLRGLSIGTGGFRVNNKPVQSGMSPIFQRPGQTTPARPAAPAPASRPAAAKPKPTSTATTGFQLAKQGIDLSKPSAASAATPVRRSLAQDLADIRKMRLASQMRQSGQNVVSTQLSSFDPFDVIKGHLIDEGHSEEEALKIMISMTEEERNAIIEQMTVNVADVKGGTQAAKNAQAGIKGKDGQPLYKPGVGVGPDFKLKGV